MESGADADVAAIQALLDRITAAWARGDGAGYGACFTPDATYITFVGTLYRGADEIGRAHQALFDSLLKDTRLASEVLDLRRYGTDTAVVTTRGDTHKGRPGRPRKLQTYTVVRVGDGRWLVAAFQNTQRRQLMEAISFRLKPATRPQPGGGAGVRT